MEAIEEEPVIYVSYRIWFHRLTVATGCGYERAGAREVGLCNGYGGCIVDADGAGSVYSCVVSWVSTWEL